MTDTRLETVFQGDSLMEAELVKGLIEAQGILCEIPGELATDHFTSAEQVTGGDELEVRVPREHAERARAIIRQAIEDGKRLEGFVAENPGAAPGDDGGDPAP